MKAVEFIYRIATGNPRVRLLLTPLGPLFFLGLLIVLIAASRWLDRTLQLPKLLPSGISDVLAAPFLIFGTGLIFWSIFHFLLARGTPVPFNPPPKIVTSGPYAYVRNPMYLGAFIAMLGVGFLLRSFSLIFCFLPLLVLLIEWALRTVEEPELEKRLQQPYMEYKKRVPRFVPVFRQGKP